MVELVKLSSPEYFEVRCSALNDALACMRRYSATAFRPDVEKTGHVLMPRRNGVGAAIGTALHAMMAELFRQKQMFGRVNVEQIDAALEKVWPKFKEELGDEPVWDKTTPHELTAFEQVKAMAEAFLPMVERINPFKIEQEYKQLISPLGNQAVPIMLTGHIDLLDDRFIIDDWKTSSKGFPAVYGQLGGYLILTRLVEGRADGARINYVPRKGIKSLADIAPNVRSQKLDTDECLRQAWTVLKEIQSHYMQWLESDGDVQSFPADNNTHLCTLNFCSAFGTSYCKVGRTF